MTVRRPEPGWVLPPPVKGWPSVLVLGPGDGRGDSGLDGHRDDGDVRAALARIRAEELWWPLPRRAAVRPRALALGPAFMPALRAALPDADIACSADPWAVAPDRLEMVLGPPDAAMLRWAAFGGIDAPGAPNPLALLSAARGRSPWTGTAIGLDEALDAQSLLRGAALRVGGRAGLVAMSPWKRRCLRPFLTGPDGPPLSVRSAGEARRRGLTPVVWGAGEDADADALRVEDGFLRSVGLGLRHAPPLSLTIGAAPPHFDATRPNGFEATVAGACFDGTLIARAAALRTRVVALALTKYNLSGAGCPPDSGGREAVLVAGQVSDDASIRLGAFGPRDDLGLLQAARARFPDAFLLYRPHPDVRTGLRAGLAPAADVAALADAVGADLAADACFDWADRVATITSLMGFEALLRGKAVTTFGRPFYAGWGLTDDVDPPSRSRRLSLDELTAAALILHPAYVDPATGLPAPPEVVVEALARERAAAGGAAAQLRAAWRFAASSLLAWF